MGWLKSAAIIASWTFLSRVLGFIRDVLIAATLGTGVLGEAFIVAFRLPNLFRRLFADGALLAAIVPVYDRVRHEKGKAAARIFTGSLFYYLGLAVLLFSGLFMLFMPQVIISLAPGFSERPDILSLAIILGMINFPFLGFMVLSSLLGGVLNANKQFWVASAAPVILNLFMITALLLPELAGLNTAHQLSTAVAFAGLVQTSLLLYFIVRLKLIHLPCWPSFSPEIKQFFMLMLPGILSAGVLQINLVVGTQIASFLDQGAIAYLYYADRLTQLPIGLIGVALGTALLPSFSTHRNQNNQQALNEDFTKAVSISLLLTFPALSGLICFAEPILFTLFNYGVFSVEDVYQTASVMQMMAIGILPAILIKTLSAVFFAHENTKTPLKLSMVAVAVNLPLAFILSHYLGAKGIALASAFAALIALVGYCLCLSKLGLVHLEASFFNQGARIIMLNLIFMLLLIGMNWGIEFAFLSVFSRIILLAGMIALALAAYAVLVILFKLVTLNALKTRIRRRFSS